MGLDVCVYSNIRYVDQYDDNIHADIFEQGGYLVTFLNVNNYPKQSEGLINNGIYSYVDFGHWRAGSYSSYSVFRDTLAKVAGYSPRQDTEQKPYKHCLDLWEGVVTEGPFAELINFSDCEGIINTECCIKLYNDFDKYLEIALAYQGEYAEYFKEVYMLFLNGLKIAANEGCLRFC